MELANKLVQLIHIHPDDILNQLDSEKESADITAIKEAVSIISSTLGKDKETTKKLIAILSKLEFVLSYTALLNHPIYLNEFKDKYGNKYLQARTSVKEMGKTKWVSAYVGKLEEYPKGIKDPEALKKGQVLVRQKIKKYFGLKQK